MKFSAGKCDVQVRLLFIIMNETSVDEEVTWKIGLVPEVSYIVSLFLYVDVVHVVHVISM